MAIQSTGGMGLRSGLTVAVLSGLVYGVLGMLVIGVTLALVSGLPTRPPLGAAALSGMVAGAVLILTGGAGVRRRVTTAAVIFAGLVALTVGRPFGLSMAEGSVWQVIALVLLVWTMTEALWRTVGAAPAGLVRRYDFETLMIRLATGAGFVVFTVFVALPFYVMVMTSFKSQQALLANPLDFSIDLGQDNLFRSYVTLFTEFNFGTYVLNSAIVSICTVVLTLLIAVPGAYAVARLRFRGAAFLNQSILLIYMVPAIVLVLPLYAVFSQLELRNSMLGLLIVYPATTTPVALYMLQGYFRGLPAEMEEAGLMDGLTRIGVILKITVPLSLPAMASVGLYVFMIAWNEFLFAFMFLDDPGIFTLPRGVASLNSSELPREMMMAGAVIATVPIMAIFLWLERFMVQGLAAGAVKG